jgi:homoserine dehydrogenase
MSVDSFLASGNSPGDFSRPAALVAASPRCCRVGILGFGTVGSAIARRLGGAAPALSGGGSATGTVNGLELTHILDRRAFAKRDGLLGLTPSFRSDIIWTTRVEDVLASDADLVVEAIGGIEPAGEWIRAALLAGKSVVTANKQVIAHQGPALLQLAERQGRQLRFEAAVGGAMPIVRAVSDGLAGDEVTRIVAILNGTSNAVLSRMEATGCSMADALVEARHRGWAEADPSADLDGLDARAKLTILCGLGFRLRVDPARIDTRSIAALQTSDFEQVRRRGGAIRQLAFAEYDRARASLTAWVAPVVVPRSSIFARTTGPQNAALITGEHAGEIGVFGPGAGGAATAVAAIGDLLAIARDRAAIVPAPRWSLPALIKGLERDTAMVDFMNRSDDPQTGRRLAEAV